MFVINFYLLEFLKSFSIGACQWNWSEEFDLGEFLQFLINLKSNKFLKIPLAPESDAPLNALSAPLLHEAAIPRRSEAMEGEEGKKMCLGVHPAHVLVRADSARPCCGRETAVLPPIVWDGFLSCGV